jgi:hypothetical protein
MSTEQPNRHLTLVELWDYRKKTRQLSDTEMKHLMLCGECVSALGICHVAKTFEQAERMMRETKAA